MVGNRATANLAAAVQREAKEVGDKFDHDGLKSPYKSITAEFDGKTFTVIGDGKDLVSSKASSGHPNTVEAKDSKTVGGAPSDSYLNNLRYVGIKDKGPIPEGEYSFRPRQISTFSAMEQAQMILGGAFTDPFGRKMHGGDWGAGRVALRPVKILPSKYGGNTLGRNGFYLHGGIMPGSSGCIDVGNSGFSSVVDALKGYREVIKVTVKYSGSPPKVGPIDRAMGRFMYPDSGGEGLADRIGALFD